MITPRLESIINLITTDTIADIGTDHAYIPIRLAQDGKIKKAIACDKNKGPLEIAAQNIEHYQLSDIIETRLGDGLNPLRVNEVSDIVIAGMGGKLICNILSENLHIAKASTLILQPMNAQYELRKFLYENGFTIKKEDLSCEGFKVYNVMIVESGEDNSKYDELDFHIPPQLSEHKLFSMLKEKKEREFIKILNGQKSSARDFSAENEYYSKLLLKLDNL